jgi:hypothetical protein
LSLGIDVGRLRICYRIGLLAILAISGLRRSRLCASDLDSVFL